jgi:polyketide biosynthesis 3-hydroxy-3-methylglutaryl-CoA synthase-like enzyme PksG
MRTVGIEDAAVYAGRAVMDVDRLLTGRGLDLSRAANLMMRSKTVALPCEDPVTNAVNAAKPIVDRLDEADRERLELLVVATESGLDLSKSVANLVHRQLGLPKTCRMFEVKQACYGGTAALQTALAMVASGPRPGGKALVIATDVSHPVRGTYHEPSQGSGSVAVLVSDAPVFAWFHLGANGFHSFEVMDTWRPEFACEMLDSDASLLSYMECVQGAFADYAKKVDGADVLTSFDLLAMHIPFGGMVRGAHRTLLRGLTRLTPAEIADDFRQRVEPSIRYGQRVGNTYSASLFLALISALVNSDHDTTRRIGLFSYGSGCSSEFYSCTAEPTPALAELKAAVEAELDGRLTLDWDTYDSLVTSAVDRPPVGMRDLTVDFDEVNRVLEGSANGTPRLVLTGVADYRRSYAWATGAL